MTTTINQEIEINAYTFVNKRGLEGVPKTVTVGDQQYSFIDSGLRYLIHKSLPAGRQGQHLVSLFDMTDGQNIYRLRNEDNHWTLVNIKPLA